MAEIPAASPAAAIPAPAAAAPAENVPVTSFSDKPAESKPAEVKPAEAKPAEAAKSPVSTSKPASLIADAGKAQPNADGSKPADAGDGKDKGKEGEKPADGTIVPEKYEVKVPDGMTLDAGLLEKFTPIAKELGLTNDQVQKLADFQAQQITQSQQAQAKAFNDFKDTTRQAAVDFFGNKLEAELPYVAKGRDQFADAEVMDLLEATGLSNHKAFISMFAKMGRSVSEHKLVDGKPASPEETRSPGSILYDKKK